MDKIPILSNFSQTFTTVSSVEENAAINHLSISHQHIRYSEVAILERGLSNINTPLGNSWNVIIKRGFDILISLVLIAAILSWLIPLLAILIKLDSRGPVFFLQKRNKDGGRLFTCIKFRSMFVNKEADILVACENDKRITRFGKFLRKCHIDELPQLINVLIGDMSIIGPRPHMVSENIIYGNLFREYDFRHSVRPGITGLAQSYGNFGATTDLEKVKERIVFDIQYISSWSLKMDIKILYRTFLLMLG
ncbi:MAG TPA: sugar transferase [Chitinophagaceae bacterium]|nr:sugar transferase [Chitinophagaceae bacterium]